MESLLFFKSYQSNATDGADRTWIHPSGRMAAVIDGVSGCRDARAAAERCVNFLNDCDPARLLSEPLVQVLERMHADLLAVDNDLMCVAGLVRYQDPSFEAAWVGNPRLYATGPTGLCCLSGPPQIQPLKVLGMPQDFSVQSCLFPLEPRSVYLFCTDGLDHMKLDQSLDRIQAARNDTNWLRLGDQVSREQDWSFLVFPVERSLSFENPEWPYYPFIGPQEEYRHEKHGLAELADALFKEPDFFGFKIVGSVTIARANSTRRPDGILVSPYGIVLLELKDHDTEVTLSYGKCSDMHVMKPEGLDSEPNPIRKLVDMMPTFGSYQLTTPPMAPLRTELSKIGAVVFTNPRARVTCFNPAGERSGLPHQAADVLVVTTSQMAPMLRRFARTFIGRKGKLLDAETIDAICGNLVIELGNNPDTKPSSFEIGRFVIEAEPVAEESTPYFQFHRGRFRDRDKRVVAKRFNLNTMHSTEEEEMERLGREGYVNGLLPRVPGIQHCHGRERGEHCLWVILEDVDDSPLLAKWLDGNPQRSERLSLLRDLAETLSELAAENIVHRSLSPSNIRVHLDGRKPLLTNFELCRLEDVATLPMAGRRLLDVKFIPEESNTSGRSLTPAADVYSFAKIACFVLSPNRSLPFGTWMEQSDFARQRRSWEKLAASLGLPVEGAKQLERMMAPNPERRPIGKELVQIVEGWL